MKYIKKTKALEELAPFGVDSIAMLDDLMRASGMKTKAITEEQVEILVRNLKAEYDRRNLTLESVQEDEIPTVEEALAVINQPVQEEVKSEPVSIKKAAENLGVKASELMAVIEEAGGDVENLDPEKINQYGALVMVKRNASTLSQGVQDTETLQKSQFEALAQLTAQQKIYLADNLAAIGFAAFDAQVAHNDTQWLDSHIGRVLRQMQEMGATFDIARILSQYGLELPKSALGKGLESMKKMDQTRKLLAQQVAYSPSQLMNPSLKN